ncbi:MAG: GNAT family N-acetyltransferase [Candidatus Methanofastidiosa archaeon]|nr:GNAT family N-acetyltransferase [Candidatus Methanofastidiosa archaeon]
MIRLIQPLGNNSDFDKLNDVLSRCLDYDDSFKFLSYSLIRFDKKTIESLTVNHKGQGIDYIVYEVNNFFSGVLAYKRNKFQGFELFLLAVDKDSQKQGIGQDLINECIKIAANDHFKSIDSFVFADNKKMLRLLIKNDFRPVDIQFHARADGMDLMKLRKYLE